MTTIIWVISVALVLPFYLCGSAKGIGSHVPAKTIETADGDIFDCVDMYKQPALNHPLLKDHQILTEPVGVNLDDIQISGSSDANGEKSFHVEMEDDAKCPPGTVPIHRVPKTNLTDGRKQTLGNSKGLVHLWATTEGMHRNYFGASARLNVYTVDNVQRGQESSAIVGIKNSDVPMEIRPEIRAGWKVAPAIFGDGNSRTFVEWSGNGGRTRCLNHRCPGFVQMNPNVYLGAKLVPVSTYRGKQYYIPFYIYKDGVNNWWVSMHDLSNKVGYWPRELFKEFGYGTTPYFGGVVTCKHGEFCPAMGNGHQAEQLRFWDHACRVERVKVIGPDFRWGGLSSNKLNNYITNSGCHTIGEYVRDADAYRFTFGGPPCKTKF